MDALRHDITFALRQLRAAPSFALIAVVTLALGIGANSAIFALVDATLLKPLPYGDPDRLAAIHETNASGNRGFSSPLNMIDWQARSRSIEKIAGYAPGVGGMVMAGRDGNSETVSRHWVSAEIFQVLGVDAIAGRTFTAEDDVKRANVVVFSESFWETRFNRDRSIIGTQMRFDGDLWTVVGVVPKEFALLGNTSMWAVRPILNLPPRARAAFQWHAVARVKPGVALTAANADLSAVTAGLAAEFPEFNKGRSATLVPLHDALIGGDLRTTSMLFLGVVGFVLLICCANVANLLLARATTRTRELAVRTAMGATRGRIIRQLLTESLLLAVIGGAAGIAVGAAILRVAPAVIPQGLLPATVALTFDLRVAAFCLAAAVGVGVVFCLAPAWQATNFSAPQAISSDARTTTGGGGALRGMLVVGEVATAVLLLFGAGLLLRTLIAVDSFDRGYRAESVLSMLLDPLGSKYPTEDALQQFYDQVEAEIRAVPGVQDMAFTGGLPLNLFEGGGFPYEIVGDAPVEAGQRPTMQYQSVSPSYFSTLDLPIVQGRNFDTRDHRNSVRVCIVNEAFARAMPGRPVIGQRVSIRFSASPQAQPVVLEVVGVAKQIKGRPDERKDFVQVYVPIAQDLSDDIYVVVRPRAGTAAALTPTVRAAISRIDKDQLVSIRDIRTLEDIDWAVTGRHRFRAALVGAFAVLALLLAMVGVFGTLAYTVQQRLRDFGVRRALGATTNDVMRLVAVNAARLIGIGAAIGLAAAAGFSRLIASMLFGVQPLDLATFGVVSLILALTAVAAIGGPAWRAARIDPATALRRPT